MLEITKVTDSEYAVDLEKVAFEQTVEKNGKSYNMFYIENKDLYFKYCKQGKGDNFMALEKSKSMTLTGVSKVGNDVVVSLTANLSTDSTSSDYINQSISNPDLYAKNKREVRKDISEFQDYVYDQQDQIDQETATEETETK